MKTETHHLIFRFLLITTGVVIAFGGILLIAKPRFEKGQSLPPRLHPVADFTLIDQSGREFKSDDLKGKVWIADFIFTRCAGPCPKMSAEMARIQAALAGYPGVRLISFSVDPEYDQPAVLERYAGMFGADPQIWKFLTGSKKAIYDLSIQSFRLGVGEDEMAGEQDMSQRLLHSTKFVLVDQDGWLRGYYDSTEPASLKQLRKHIARLNSND